MKTGRLLDILSGHEGPVHGLMFSPTNVSQFVLPFLFVANKVKLCVHIILASAL